MPNKSIVCCEVEIRDELPILVTFKDNGGKGMPEKIKACLSKITEVQISMTYEGEDPTEELVALNTNVRVWEWDGLFDMLTTLGYTNGSQTSVQVEPMTPVEIMKENPFCRVKFIDDQRFYIAMWIDNGFHFLMRMTGEIHLENKGSFGLNSSIDKIWASSLRKSEYLNFEYGGEKLYCLDDRLKEIKRVKLEKQILDLQQELNKLYEE